MLLLREQTSSLQVTERDPSCGQRDGNFPNVRCNWIWNWFTMNCHVFQNQANGVFSHAKCFWFIPAIGHYFRQRRYTHGEASLISWLKDDCKRSRMINHHLPPRCRL